MDLTSLQLLVDNSKTGVFIYEVGPEQFTYLNPAFKSNYHLTEEERVSPGALLELVYPEDQALVVESFRMLLQEKGSPELEFRLQGADQEAKWVRVTPFISGNAPGKVNVVGYVEDITASKKYVDYLIKFGNKKNAVLSILAHDLAGPLAMVQSLSGVLAEELKANDNQELYDLTSLIQSTSAHGVALIKDFTDQEFLETTGVNLVKRKVNIVKRFREVMEEFQQSQDELGKTFRFISSSSEIYINFDDTKLLQAVTNIISNAIKFTPEGGTITVSLEEKPQTVLIKVEDTGIGIPKEFHATLFDKFTNASRPGLKGEPSTGLGMSIAKTIVEWHKGQIWFDSEENQGTTFYMEIPKD
jgi:two-component system, OmpR family, sensor histidine kinase VicK